MQTQGVRAATSAGGALAWSAAGLVFMVTASLACGAAIRSGTIVDPVIQVVLSYAVVWIPLIASIVAIYFGRGWREAQRSMGLRFHILDIPWGLAGGLFARAIDAFSRSELTGDTGLGPHAILGTPTVTVWVILAGVVAPVIIAPVVEEAFFRGVVQRSLERALVGGHRISGKLIAVAVTSVSFSAAHVILAGSTGLDAVAVAIGTFAFSAVAGVIAVATNRIGGSIVAHVVYNGVAVLLVGPW